MLDILIPLFSENILPIFLAAFAGLLLSKTTQLDPKTVSKISFYIFSPSLVFTLLTSNQLEKSKSLQMIGYTVTVTLVVGLIALLAGKLFKFDRRLLAAFMIVSIFPNAGNFGLSINSLAFGEQALAYASLYYVVSTSMIYTIGVFISSLGQKSLKDTFFGLFKLPVIYALLIASIFNLFDLKMPVSIDRSINILGQAAIPAMLILLGLQLGRVNLSKFKFQIGLASVLRLIAAPLIAILLSSLFNLHNPADQAGIIEASMPTAVMMTVLATEYDLYPQNVTSVVTITTLLSPMIITPLLSFLGGSF